MQRTQLSVSPDGNIPGIVDSPLGRALVGFFFEGRQVDVLRDFLIDLAGSHAINTIVKPFGVGCPYLLRRKAKVAEDFEIRTPTVSRFTVLTASTWGPDKRQDVPAPGERHGGRKIRAMRTLAVWIEHRLPLLATRPEEMCTR